MSNRFSNHTTAESPNFNPDQSCPVSCHITNDLESELRKHLESGGRILQKSAEVGTHPFAVIQDTVGHIAILSQSKPDNRHIEVLGAKTHNLQNIDVCIPLDKITAVAGVSGSGKSSLVYDTIYSEAQQRLFEGGERQESLHSKHTNVDFISSLPPVQILKQWTFGSHSRSTVGTLAHITDLFRILYSRYGKPLCPFTGETIGVVSGQEIADHLGTFQPGVRVEINIPIMKYNALLHGISIDLKKHSEVVIGTQELADIASALNLAFTDGGGFLQINVVNSSEAKQFYDTIGTSSRKIVATPLSPEAFSFNTLSGACTTCNGLGNLWTADHRRVVTDSERSLHNWPFAGLAFPNSKWSISIVNELAKAYDFDLHTKYTNLPNFVKDLLLNGTGKHLHRVDKNYFGLGHTFEGILERVNRKYQELKDSGTSRALSLRKLMEFRTCPTCGGRRIKAQRDYITVQKLDLHSLGNLTIEEVNTFLTTLINSSDFELRTILDKIQMRISSLISLGLGYLRLNQPSTSVSGGEGQRIRLSSHIATGLINMLYVLDEPSIGLHPKDKAIIIQAMKNLRERGNTVLVVEHDEQIIRSADHVIELGPGGGEKGGNVVFAGRFQDILNDPQSKTGTFFSHRNTLLPKTKRKLSDQAIKIKGARCNNLNGIDVTLPLGVLTCVTGPSGSGKSTLVDNVLGNALLAKFRKKRVDLAQFESIDGCEFLDDVAIVDQTPIGKSSRSNPATFCNFYDSIRSLYSEVAYSNNLNFSTPYFSFNTKEGRCISCRGRGTVQGNLPFLASYKKTCPDCQGTRFKAQVLKVKYKEKNIAEVLAMSIDDGIQFFKDSKVIRHKLFYLQLLGLGYLKIGHPLSELSGGENQRLKLSEELSKIKPTKRILYVLDEPTTGLHLSEIIVLLEAIDRLLDAGHSVVVIEHHLDVIGYADYIIDLGPGGGPNGGKIIAAGTPEEIMANQASQTGLYLKKHLLSRK